MLHGSHLLLVDRGQPALRLRPRHGQKPCALESSPSRACMCQCFHGSRAVCGCSDLAGSVYFICLPAGVRLEVSMMKVQALDTTAGIPKQSQRDYSASME